MKLYQLNENGSRLHVHIKGDVYSCPIYKDFNSIKDLCDDIGCKRKDLEYFYSKGI